MKSQYSFASLKPKYEKILETVQLINRAGTQAVVDKILKNKYRYEAVEKLTGLPWELIGAIHSKEASCNFNRNLMNGQPLNQKTTIVPIGYGPWDTWEQSAFAAIAYENRLTYDLKNQTREQWSITECLFFAEGYNGFGYIAKGINSPYVWAGSNAYTSGGFPRDHVFDRNYIVKNPGVWCILHLLEFDKHDQTVKLTFEERGDHEGYEFGP